jgi:hypothetical protein
VNHSCLLRPVGFKMKLQNRTMTLDEATGL